MAKSTTRILTNGEAGGSQYTSPNGTRIQAPLTQSTSRARPSGRFRLPLSSGFADIPHKCSALGRLIHYLGVSSVVGDSESTGDFSGGVGQHDDDLPRENGEFNQSLKALVGRGVFRLNSGNKTPLLPLGNSQGCINCSPSCGGRVTGNRHQCSPSGRGFLHSAH